MPTACALMRMLMSFDTSTTSRFGYFCLRYIATPRITLSGFCEATDSGISTFTECVCRKSEPPACCPPLVLSVKPFSMSPPWETISSRKRLAWRAFLATSLMPFLWSSSSSSVTIGRNTSCSSKRNRLVGACLRTLVSSTKSLGAADALWLRGPSLSRLRCMGTSECEANPGVSSASLARGEESLRGSLGISSVGWWKKGSEGGGADEIEHFLRVAGDLHPAPLLRDRALAFAHEG